MAAIELKDAIPWLLAIVSIAVNVVLGIKNYRLQQEKAEYERRKRDPAVELTPSFAIVNHERIMSVMVESTGADIYDFALVLLVPRSEGAPDPLPLKCIGDIPQPLRSPRRFELINDEPHKESGLANVPLDKIRLVAFNGAKEIKSICVAEFLEKMIHADPKLPPKPHIESASNYFRRTSNY